LNPIWDYVSALVIIVFVAVTVILFKFIGSIVTSAFSGIVSALLMLILFILTCIFVLMFINWLLGI